MQWSMCLQQQLLLLLLLLLLLTSTRTSANSSVDRSAVAAVELDIAGRDASELMRWTEGLTESLVTRMQTRSLLTKATSEMAVRMAEKSSIVVSALSFAVSILSDGSASSRQLSFLSEVLQKVNAINDGVSKIEDHLPGDDELDDRLRRMSAIRRTIRVGAGHFRVLLQEAAAAGSQRELDSAAQKFVRLCESVDGLLDAGIRLHALAIDDKTDAFGMAAEANFCSTADLSGLMLRLSVDLQAASEISLAHSLLSRHADAAGASVDRHRRFLLDIRRAFKRQRWLCLERIRNAADDLSERLLERLQGSAEVRMQGLQRQLELRFPEFAWAVARVADVSLLTNGSAGVGLFSRRDGDSLVVVAFVDAEDPVGCDDATRALVRLRLSCSGGCAVAASLKIATSAACDSASTSSSMWMALGTRPGPKVGPCSDENDCNGHGTCQRLRLLRRPICRCSDLFDGDTCGVVFNESGRTPAALVASLREVVGELTGAKTAVDVYYKLVNIRDTLAREMHSASACVGVADILKVDTMRWAEHVVSLYSSVLRKTRSLGEFGSLMRENLKNRDVYFLLFDLKRLLLGSNRLMIRSTGMLSAYKHCASTSKGACTDKYTKSLKHMRDSIVLLYHSVGEALISYYSWRTDQLSETDRVVYLHLQKNFTHHPSEFAIHWRALSCPSLTVGGGLSGWSRRHCRSNDSYEGMTLPVECDPGYKKMTESVTCRRVGKNLQWSTTPKCLAPWAAWSSWSSCSVSCGGGTQRRIRCRGGDCKVERDNESRECNTTDCCIVNFGYDYFRCHNGRDCTRESDRCNGRNDCNDGSDERGCNFVRSGDHLSLHRDSSPSYVVNCYCTSRCWWYSAKCYAKWCRRWDRKCPDDAATFHMYAPNRNDGDMVRSGDYVAFMYDWHYTKWLSCLYRYGTCTARNCPGGNKNRVLRDCGGEKFQIFLLRPNRCHDTRNGHCYGNPITYNSIVAFKHGDSWLSAPRMDQTVKLMNCLQNNPMYREVGCKEERWRLRN